MFTGKSLRAARESANLTQDEVAKAAGVSLRTVGNWERSEVVPPKHWDSLREILSAARTLPEYGPSLTQSDTERLAEKNQAMVDRVLADPHELSRQREFAALASGSVQLAELAAQLGVGPDLILDFIEALTNIALDSGAIGFTPGAGDPVAITIFDKAPKAVSRAIMHFDSDNYEKSGRVSMNVLRTQVEEALSATRSDGAKSSPTVNVTPLRQTEELHEEDFEESGEYISRPHLSAAKEGRMKADEPHTE